MKMFNIKKLSWKIAIIVVCAVLIVGGAISIYFEARVIGLLDRYENMDLQNKTEKAAVLCDLVFTDAVYRVTDLRSLAESSFNLNEFKENADEYFSNYSTTVIDNFIYNTVNSDDYIFASYFAVHPDLAGFPFVGEVFYEESDNGVVHGAPQTYEEYMQVNSDDMIWFYGAYNSGKPYWTEVYDFDGTVMVSYVAPVIIDGTKVGVVGVDITIDQIIDVIKSIQVYNTGFAALEDNYNEFVESNEIVRRLSAVEKEKLVNLAHENQNEVFEIELGGVRYITTQASLMNNYSIYIFAPRSEYKAETVKSLVTFAVIFPTAIVIVIIASVLIGKSFSKPLVSLSAFMTKASTTGDLTISKENNVIINKYSQFKDEIGQTISSSAGFVKRITDISKILETISTGDLTTEVIPLSENDVMGNSLREMNTKLHEMFEDINTSAMQVSGGSKQVADGAQLLAQGSTEQAASIEELSGSVNEIAEKTKSNTTLAEKAAKLADNIKESAEKGSSHMNDMMTAVSEISEASGSINKVIKVIDDIAFQTNILALNAAVEAARAGQHGKGFAVVAEEVRSLAAKSAEAAKDTSGLIENSIEKANLGVRIAGETADSLAEIVSGINESNQLVGEIAKLSAEQSIGIEQINSGIDQVTRVVQQNSATAEESAAASEEMSSQSAVLREHISQFKLNEGSSMHSRLTATGESAKERLALSENTGIKQIDENNGNFGKY